MEFTLLAAASIGVGLFWLMIRFEDRRGNASRCTLNLWDLGLTSGSVGLLVGRLIAMIEVGINPLVNPSQIIFVRSGVSTAGASITAILVLGFLARKSLLDTTDAVAPSVLAGLAGWHLGSLLTGTWLGTASDLPWAQIAEGGTTTRHPVGVYTALLLIVASISIALWKHLREPHLGMPTGISLATAGGSMLITEPMRVSLDGGEMWLYLSALIVGCVLVIKVINNSDT